MRTAPDERQTKRFFQERYAPAVIVSTIVALTALVLCHGLRQAPVWLDEAASLAYARLSWPILWVVIRHVDSVFFFYYAFLHIIGHGNISLALGRFVSVVSALATIPLIYCIGVRVGDRRVAYTACMLCVTNFLFIMESREVRMYALLCAVCTATWLLLLILEERPTLTFAATYIAVAASSLWIHPLAAFNSCALIVATFAISRMRRTKVILIACTLISLIALVPLALISNHASAAQIGWITNDPRAAFRNASGGRLSTYLGYVLITTAIVVGVSRRNRMLFALMAWLAVPPVLGLLVSYTVLPVLSPRYYIEIVPASALLIAWLLWNIPVVPSRIAMALLAVAALFTIRRIYDVPRMAWPTVNRVLHTQSRPGDALLFFPPFMGLPEAEELRNGLTTNPGLRIIYPDPSVIVQRPLTTIRRGYRTLWAVIQSGYESKIEPAITTNYRITTKQRFPGLSVDITMEKLEPR